MHAFDILAWTCDGAVFCPNCKPAPTDRAAAVGHDDVHPWFASDEAALVGATCDGCRACFVSCGTLREPEWFPHEDAVGPSVYWPACIACGGLRPTDNGDIVEYCAKCRDGRLLTNRGRCVTPDGAKRDALAVEAARRFAWPGGYPLVARMSDGGILCGQCCDDERDTLAAPYPAPDWRIVGVECYFEGPPIPCNHCGDFVESAYGPADDTEGGAP